MTKRAKRPNKDDCATATNRAGHDKIQLDLSAARKRWQTIGQELRRKQQRLLRRLVKQRAAEDAQHQQILKQEKALRQDLHGIRVARARKRESIQAAERKIQAKRLEIDTLTEQEAVQQDELVLVQQALQQLEDQMRRDIEAELSKSPARHG